MGARARGEVWLVDLGMAAKVRPCVVISISPEDHERALVTLVPHTTAVRGTRFEAVFATGFLKAGAFDVQGLVTVPSVKLLRRPGALKPDQINRIEELLRLWLGLQP